MTKEEALEFLKAHQPMPPETELSEADMHRYEEVRAYFEQHPDPVCIPLFLNSFANDTGLGVYQMVEGVLTKFPGHLVVPHLMEALRSVHAGVRSWSAQIASLFPDKLLLSPLLALLNDDDRDIRFWAADALDAIADPSAVPALRDALAREVDPKVRALLSDVIEELKQA